MPFVLLVLLAAILPAILSADEVRLKNGDRLSGTLVRMDDKELLLKTDYAGELKIKRDSVVGIATTEAANALLRDGNTLTGKVLVADGLAKVGDASAPAADVTVFQSKAEQLAYHRNRERLANPRLIDFWKGTVDLGYAQARGNAITSTISSAVKATRTTPQDAINVSFFSLYSSNTTTGKSQLTANSIRGGVKYDANISPKWYAFGSTDLEFDEFQNLDLRLVPAGGFGSHAIKGSGTKWDWFTGGSLNREYFSNGLQRNSGELLVGNDLSHKLNGLFTFTEKVVLYNNFTEGGQVRLNGDVGIAAALLKWMSWQVAASNRFLSNPLPGRKTNDVLVTTGVRLTFTR